MSSLTAVDVNIKYILSLNKSKNCNIVVRSCHVRFTSFTVPIERN